MEYIKEYLAESGIIDMTSSPSGVGYFWNGMSIQGGNIDQKTLQLANPLS